MADAKTEKRAKKPVPLKQEVRAPVISPSVPVKEEYPTIASDPGTQELFYVIDHPHDEIEPLGGALLVSATDECDALDHVDALLKRYPMSKRTQSPAYTLVPIHRNREHAFVIDDEETLGPMVRQAAVNEADAIDSARSFPVFVGIDNDSESYPTRCCVVAVARDQTSAQRAMNQVVMRSSAATPRSVYMLGKLDRSASSFAYIPNYLPTQVPARAFVMAETAPLLAKRGAPGHTFADDDAELQNDAKRILKIEQSSAIDAI